MTDRDTLFARQGGEISDFRFDERVVRVFPDMINRSVPGYALIIPMSGLLARRFVTPDSQVYDLGCSLGASTLAVRRAIKPDNVRIIAVDNSPAMVKRCSELVQADNSSVPVSVGLGDIQETDISNASFVMLNFTLQFLPPENRADLIRRIFAGLLPGGALLLSEKLRFADDDEQSQQTDWHHDYKRAQGYSDLEIAQKRNALERVMIPDTFEAHEERLHEAGFSQVYRWFQCFNFASLIAIK